MSDLERVRPAIQGDSGEYRIPLAALCAVRPEMLRAAEEAILAHIKANPGLVVETHEDFATRDRVFRWWRE